MSNIENYICYNNDSKSDTDEEYDLNNTLLSDFDALMEIGSFEYLPPRFLDINTSTFGSTINNSYLILKNKILSSSSDPNNKDYISFEDICQAVKYMVHIPYTNGLNHLLEVCKFILANDDYPVDRRYFFFSNNEKYYKLEDNLVYELFPYFLDLCLTRNYPYNITLLCCKYMLQNYDKMNIIYEKALKFLYYVSSDINETINLRAEAADTLLEYGNKEDKDFAKKMIEQMGENYDNNLYQTIFTNSQNVHNEELNKSVRNILSNLIKDDIKLKSKYVVHMEDIHNFIVNNQNKHITNELKDCNYISILNRLLTDPSKYLGKTLSDIMIIIWRKILTFNEDTKESLYKRFFQEFYDMKDTCSSGHLSRLINILSGFIDDFEYHIKISPKDELRSSIFARINASLRYTDEKQREKIILSMSEEFDNNILDPDINNEEEILNFRIDISSNKYSVYKFVIDNIPYFELFEEYKNLISIEDFNNIFNKTVKDYMGI